MCVRVVERTYKVQGCGHMDEQSPFLVSAHLPLMSGGGRYICLSNLPGLSRAGSRTSGRLVPARTTTFAVVLNPA